jgi:hypothetical protein
MFDFSKKYSPENIQQEILKKQERQKLYKPQELKKDKEKNTVNMLRSPVLIEPETINWDRFPDILRQDANKRYQNMLGKKIKFFPYFRYSTTQNSQKNIQTATTRTRPPKTERPTNQTVYSVRMLLRRKSVYIYIFCSVYAQNKKHNRRPCPTRTYSETAYDQLSKQQTSNPRFPRGHSTKENKRNNL